jgi:hypothetical protein
MKLADLQALELISRLPDDVWLTVEEAAIFLRMSPSSLNKMRMPGHPTGGPVYSQGGKSGARGSNQKVLYKKADLKAWHEANAVSDTLAAAVRKGQLFMSLAVLAEPEAYWLNPKGEVAGLVEETDVDVFFKRLGKWEIRWMDPLEAAGEEWESLLALKTHAEALDKRISGLRNTLYSRMEEVELCEGTKPADKK